MRHSLQYYSARVFFGLFIAWIGLVGIRETEENAKFVGEFADSLKQASQEMFQYELNTQAIVKNADSLAIFVNNLLLIGGFLSLYGSKIGSKFVLTGLLMNIVFCYNFLTINEENKKRIMGGILKLTSMIGGTFFIH